MIYKAGHPNSHGKESLAPKIITLKYKSKETLILVQDNPELFNR